MEKLTLILCVMVILPLSSFKQEDYSPPKLDWTTHFKGTADGNSPFLALTAMTWKYSYISKANRNSVKIDLTNTVTVDENRSWVKWDKIKDESIRESLLHHEQGHVDIEFILLKEADRVLKNRSYSVKNYKTEIAELANQIGAYFETMQRNYDKETGHGSNHKMQARWDKIIKDKSEEVSGLSR